MTLQIIIGILIRHALTGMGISTIAVSGDLVTQVAGLVATGIGLGLSAIEKKSK